MQSASLHACISELMLTHAGFAAPRDPSLILHASKSNCLQSTCLPDTGMPVSVYVTAKTRSAAAPSFSRLELGVATYSWLNLVRADYFRVKLGLSFIMPATTRFGHSLLDKTRSIRYHSG